MFRKSTLLAVAAAASFGLVMASAGTVNAKPAFNGPHKISMPKPHGPIFKPHWPNKHPHWRVHYRHPRLWYAARPVVYGVARPVVTTNRCTCLTKEYTPEGAVLFKDICTNEAAINPPAMQPTAQVQPQQ